jgi:hypothetical protein
VVAAVFQGEVSKSPCVHLSKFKSGARHFNRDFHGAALSLSSSSSPIVSHLDREGPENRNLTGLKGSTTAEYRPAAGLPVNARCRRLLSPESNLLDLSACAVAGRYPEIFILFPVRFPPKARSEPA